MHKKAEQLLLELDFFLFLFLAQAMSFIYTCAQWIHKPVRYKTAGVTTSECVGVLTSAAVSWSQSVWSDPVTHTASKELAKWS